MGAQREAKREQTLLEELCGADTLLYALLSSCLYRTPLAAISAKDLDTLIQEAEVSGNFRPAIDKAIFEGSQSPGERGRYVEVIRNLAARTIDAAEQAKERQEEEGHTERAASFDRRIEDHRLMSERADEILDVAAKFYGERLVERGENAEREARQGKRKQLEREERAITKREERDRDAGRKERRKMTRGERRQAKKQEKLEAVAAEGRRRAREEERAEAAREEKRIREREEEDREARRKDRTGN